MPLAITSSALRALADVAKPYEVRPAPARNNVLPGLSRRFVWSTAAVLIVASLLFGLTQSIAG